MTPKRLERVACNPTPLNPTGFNRQVSLPHGLLADHVRSAMQGFLDFLGFINQQLHRKQLPRLEAFLMPANFSSMVGEFMTIAIPNWLLPFPGIDFMSKILRLVSRVAAGGLIVMVAPTGSRPAAVAGASIGAIGSTALDFFGTRLIIGAGDTGQLPLALLAPVTGVAAYGRPMLPAAQGVGAYTLPMLRGVGQRAIMKHSLFG